MGAKKGVFQADAPWTIPRGFHFLARTSQIFWWRRRDSNLRPRAYESPALPLSYAATGDRHSGHSSLEDGSGTRQRQKKRPAEAGLVGSGGRIRTYDLRVMSPTSCHCSTPRRTMSIHIARAAEQ